MARKRDWDHALDDAIKVSYTDHCASWPSYKMLTFICDTVHQHSALIDRLHLQGYRPIRKRPRPGGKGSIRCRIHIYEPSFED
jgi:hypothetical protein